MFEFYYERDIQKNFEELDKFEDVLNLFELKNLINEFINNEKYVFIIENIDFEMFETMRKSRKYSTFINNAYNGLKSFKYWIQPSIMNFNSFTSVYSIIVYSCILAYGRMLSNDELESIIFSDFPIKLTLAMDDFYNINNAPLLDKDFFRTIRDVKLDKSAKKLDKFIYHGFLLNLAEPGNHYVADVVEFSYCASYFSRCYAYSRKNKVVTTNDIADGWILTFKLFLNDIRSYIDGLESNSPCAILPPLKSRKEVKVEEKNNGSFNIKKIIAIFLSILFFCFLILVVEDISYLLTGSYYYSGAPTTRYAIFGFMLFLTSMFYSLVKNILKF